MVCGISSIEDTEMDEMKEIFDGLPDGKEQLEALKSFRDGGISYSEMRLRCG